MKVLFIDDIRNPFNYIKDVNEVCIIQAKTYSAAIQALEDFTFDIIFFDHDLGEEKTGYDIAKYIVENQIEIKDGFKIHSANVVGRKNIYELLTHYGYQYIG